MHLPIALESLVRPKRSKPHFCRYLLTPRRLRLQVPVSRHGAPPVRLESEQRHG